MADRPAVPVDRAGLGRDRTVGVVDEAREPAGEVVEQAGRDDDGPVLGVGAVLDDVEDRSLLFEYDGPGGCLGEDGGHGRQDVGGEESVLDGCRDGLGGGRVAVLERDGLEDDDEGSEGVEDEPGVRRGRVDEPVEGGDEAGRQDGGRDGEAGCVKKSVNVDIKEDKDRAKLTSTQDLNQDEDPPDGFVAGCPPGRVCIGRPGVWICRPGVWVVVRSDEARQDGGGVSPGEVNLLLGIAGQTGREGSEGRAEGGGGGVRVQDRAEAGERAGRVHGYGGASRRDGEG